MADWKKLVDERAKAGQTIGQAWFDQNSAKLKVDAGTVARYAQKQGYKLGEAWTAKAGFSDDPILSAIQKAGFDGKIKGSELSKLQSTYGQAAVANALAPYLIGNTNVSIGSGAKDLTGVRIKDGIATYTPATWQTNAYNPNGGMRQVTADTSGLGPQFVQNANGGFTYVGGAIPGTGAAQQQQQASSPQSTLDDYIAQAQDVINNIQNQQTAQYPDVGTLIQEALNTQALQNQGQLSALQGLLIQQQGQYQQQLGDAQRQQQMMAAQVTEAQRQAEALQRAFVPNLEPTAVTPAFGDTRTASRGRSAAANTLSSLAILTGLGGTGSAGATSTLAGLQIA